MTRTKNRGNARAFAAQGSLGMEVAEQAFDNSFAPKKKKKAKPTHLERLAECNISEELRVSIALALKKLETSDEQKAELELPSSLTSEERKYIHIVAQQMGFKSKSRGPRDCRTPTISKRDPKEQPIRLKSWKRRALRYGGVAELMRQKEEREKVRELEREHERLLRIEQAKGLLSQSSPENGGGPSAPEARNEQTISNPSNFSASAAVPPTTSKAKKKWGKNDPTNLTSTVAAPNAMGATPVARQEQSNVIPSSVNAAKALPPKDAGQPCRRYSDGDRHQSRPRREAPPFINQCPPSRDDRHRNNGENRGQQHQPRRGFNGPFRTVELGRNEREPLPRRGGNGPYPVPSGRDGLPCASGHVARLRSPLRPPKLEMDDSTWIMLNANDKLRPLHAPPPGPSLMPGVNMQPPSKLYGQPFNAPPNITPIRIPPTISARTVSEQIPYDRPFSHHSHVPHQPHEPNYAEVAGRSVPHWPHEPHYAAAASRPLHQHYQERAIHVEDAVQPIHSDQYRPSDHYSEGDRDRDARRRHSAVIPFSFGEHYYEYDTGGLVISPSEPVDPCYGYYTRGNEPRTADTPQPRTAAQVKQEAMSTLRAQSAEQINCPERKFNPADVKLESPSSVPFRSCADVRLSERDHISDLERQERNILSCVGVADTDDVPSSEDEDLHEHGSGSGPGCPPATLNRALVRSGHQVPQHRTHSPRQSLSGSDGESRAYEIENSDRPLDSPQNSNWKREPSPDCNSSDVVDSRWRETEREYLGIPDELVGLRRKAPPNWCTPKTNDEPDSVAFH